MVPNQKTDLKKESFQKINTIIGTTHWEYLSIRS